MMALDKLMEISTKQNPFVVKSKRLKKEAEEDKDTRLLFFYISIYLDDNGSTGKSYLNYDDIEYVEYVLHPTFPDRYRVSKDREKKFEIRIWTYGFFSVKAKLFLRAGKILEARGKVEFLVTQDEKNHNSGELE